ncbi:hypothetical protein AGMMS50212_06600 [Spirochaetia bacterium]|nr:hypothetical protein AGMMS50212_06600 [Spirochaetia bacterium]
MTLSKHVLFLKLGTGFSAAALVAFFVVSFKIIPFYPDLVSSADRSIHLFGLLPAPSAYVPFATTLAALVYALVAQILIFYFFEKTQLAELRLFSVFVFSFIFEIFRVMAPLSKAFNLTMSYPQIAARLLVFGHYYGIFSLFAASLYAAGIKNQKEENILIPMFIIAVLISFRIPVDVFSWNTDFSPVTGYMVMSKILNYAILIIAVLSFFIAAFTRGMREYYFIGAGVFIICLGRSLFLGADTWIIAAIGFLVLVFGTWSIGYQLRRMYLWI